MLLDIPRSFPKTLTDIIDAQCSIKYTISGKFWIPYNFIKIVSMDSHLDAEHFAISYSSCKVLKSKRELLCSNFLYSEKVGRFNDINTAGARKHDYKTFMQNGTWGASYCQWNHRTWFFLAWSWFWMLVCERFFIIPKLLPFAKAQSFWLFTNEHGCFTRYYFII